MSVDESHPQYILRVYRGFEDKPRCLKLLGSELELTSVRAFATRVIQPLTGIPIGIMKLCMETGNNVDLNGEGEAAGAEKGEKENLEEKSENLEKGETVENQVGGQLNLKPICLKKTSEEIDQFRKIQEHAIEKARTQQGFRFTNDHLKVQIGLGWRSTVADEEVEHSRDVPTGNTEILARCVQRQAPPTHRGMSKSKNAVDSKDISPTDVSESTSPGTMSSDGISITPSEDVAIDDSATTNATATATTVMGVANMTGNGDGISHISDTAAKRSTRDIFGHLLGRGEGTSGTTTIRELLFLDDIRNDEGGRIGLRTCTLRAFEEEFPWLGSEGYAGHPPKKLSQGGLPTLRGTWGDGLLKLIGEEQPDYSDKLSGLLSLFEDDDGTSDDDVEPRSSTKNCTPYPRAVLRAAPWFDIKRLGEAELRKKYECYATGDAVLSLAVALDYLLQSERREREREDMTMSNELRKDKSLSEKSLSADPAGNNTNNSKDDGFRDGSQISLFLYLVSVLALEPGSSVVDILRPTAEGYLDSLGRLCSGRAIFEVGFFHWNRILRCASKTGHSIRSLELDPINEEKLELDDDENIDIPKEAEKDIDILKEAEKDGESDLVSLKVGAYSVCTLRSGIYGIIFENYLQDPHISAQRLLCTGASATNSLIYAAANGNLRLMKLLVESAKGTLHPEMMTTSTNDSASQHSSFFCECLLKALRQKTSDEKFGPIHWAARHGHADCLDYLLQQVQYLRQCRKLNVIQAIQLVNEAGGNDAAKKTKTRTPLLVAAHHNHYEAVIVLLKYPTYVRVHAKDTKETSKAARDILVDRREVLADRLELLRTSCMISKKRVIESDSKELEALNKILSMRLWTDKNASVADKRWDAESQSCTSKK